MPYVVCRFHLRGSPSSGERAGDVSPGPPRARQRKRQ